MRKSNSCKFEFISYYYEVVAIPTSGSLVSASLEEFTRPGERGVCAFSSKSLPFVPSVLSTGRVEESVERTPQFDVG